MVAIILSMVIPQLVSAQQPMRSIRLEDLDPELARMHGQQQGSAQPRTTESHEDKETRVLVIRQTSTHVNVGTQYCPKIPGRYGTLECVRAEVGHESGTYREQEETTRTSTSTVEGDGDGRSGYPAPRAYCVNGRRPSNPWEHGCRPSQRSRSGHSSPSHRH